MEIFKYIKGQQKFLAFKIGLQDAEDIIQDVFEIVWKKREYFENKNICEQKKIITYVIQHRWMDTIRHWNMKKRIVDTSRMKTIQKPTVYSLLDLKDLMKKVEDRNLQFLLETALGYKAEEIAVIHNKTLDQARSQVKRDRATLRKLFK